MISQKLEPDTSIFPVKNDGFQDFSSFFHFFPLSTKPGKLHPAAPSRPVSWCFLPVVRRCESHWQHSPSLRPNLYGHAPHRHDRKPWTPLEKMLEHGYGSKPWYLGTLKLLLTGCLFPKYCNFIGFDFWPIVNRHGDNLRLFSLRKPTQGIASSKTV